MPGHDDYVKRLQLLIVAVDHYPLVDDDWRQARTKKAIEAREKMIARANDVMACMKEPPLAKKELDAVFWNGDMPASINFTDSNWKEVRISRHMKVALVQHLVYEVYAYRAIDPEWADVAEKRASIARQRMEDLARRIMFQMCGETLTNDDITTVFWSE
jgi:hypothetical protein